MPLFVANHEEFEISACQFSVSFDTSVVQLLEISTDSGLARDWMMTHGDLQSDSVMVAMGGGTASLGYGEGELVRFLFEVGSEAPDGAVSTLELGDVEVDEANGLTARLSGNRLHVRGFDGRGCTVTLFDMTGRVVYRKRLTQREAGITLLW